ncbi:unnamed protein product, partial [Meganyctiphanes norvegica]
MPKFVLVLNVFPVWPYGTFNDHITVLFSDVVAVHFFERSMSYSGCIFMASPQSVLFGVLTGNISGQNASHNGYIYMVSLQCGFSCELQENFFVKSIFHKDCIEMASLLCVFFYALSSDLSEQNAYHIHCI